MDKINTDDPLCFHNSCPILLRRILFIGRGNPDRVGQKLLPKIKTKWTSPFEQFQFKSSKVIILTINHDREKLLCRNFAIKLF